MTTLHAILNLASEARPRSSSDWGTERQINAINAFHEAIAAQWPVELGEDSDFADFCLKATDDEQINSALAIIASLPPIPGGTINEAIAAAIDDWRSTQPNVPDVILADTIRNLVEEAIEEYLPNDAEEQDAE